jgi:opacity protein-like surface antigen
MLKKILLIIAIMALIVSCMNAQSISLGPQLGYYKAQDADNGSYMGGAALRLKLNSVLGVEASINYRSEQYGNGALTVRSWPVTVTGLIYPLPIIYGAMGFGWYNVTYDYDQSKPLMSLFQDETTQKVGWHFGGGLELPIGSSVILTGDIRYVFLNYDFKQLPGSGASKSNFTIFTVGLLFSL